jgi:hypothetical protein
MRGAVHPGLLADPGGEMNGSGRSSLLIGCAGLAMLSLAPQQRPAFETTVARIRFDVIVAAYVEVIFGRNPVVSGDLFNAAGTERIAELPPLAMPQSADGIFRGALRMTGIPAGDYALQVAVTDAAAGQHRLFRIPFRVRSP